MIKKQGVGLYMVLMFGIILLLGNVESFAKADGISEKIVKKLNKHWSRASKFVLISETDFYDSESHISLPLALELKSQLVNALEENGFTLIEPSNQISTAWVIQCRWKQDQDKLKLTYLASPWKNWKLGRLSVASNVVNRNQFPESLYQPDMDSFSRSIVHRLALNDNITKPRSVYLRPLVVNGAVGGKSSNHYFNQWLKSAVEKSNLLLPINVNESLANLSVSTVRTRGFRPREKQPSLESSAVQTSLTGDLLERQSELAGTVDLKNQLVKVNVDLMSQDGEQLASAIVDVPLVSLPKLVVADLKKVGEMEAQNQVSQHGLHLDISTTRGEGETHYREGETIQFYLRLNRAAYIYLFDLDSKGNAVLLYPHSSLNTIAKVAGEQVLVLPDDGLPYEIVVSEPYGKDIIWAVASDEELNIPHVLSDDWAVSDVLKQRIRDLGKMTEKGYAEAQVLVTTSK